MFIDCCVRPDDAGKEASASRCIRRSASCSIISMNFFPSFFKRSSATVKMPPSYSSVNAEPPEKRDRKTHLAP